MLAQAQRLTAWRKLLSLYHHNYPYHHHFHPRLLSSSVARGAEANNSTNPWDSFGRLATSGQQGSEGKESISSSEKLSRSPSSFPRPAQGFSKSCKDSSGLSQNDLLEKWYQFRDADYQERQVRWGEGEQDNEAEEYRHFVPRGTTGSLSQEVALGKTSSREDSPRKLAQSLNEEAGDVSGSGGLTQGLSKQGGVFGGMNPQVQEPEGDEGDIREEDYQKAKLKRRHRPHFYAIKMKQLCRQRKLAEAIKVLEEEMPAAGTKPDNFCFQVLINSCGRAGFSNKTFQLYNQMKKRGLKVQPVAYTGLFTACAHSPWPTTDGLQRATHLRTELKNKGYHFNQTISHAMIKAFGWCGDMRTAFLVVDEMIQDGVLVTTETINFLLQACITNKETGFRHAVKVWRKMRQLRLKPDIYTYNLLMRVMKDCGAGDPSLTSSLLEEEGAAPSQSNTAPQSNNKHCNDPQQRDFKGTLLDSQEHRRSDPEGTAAHLWEEETHLERLAVSSSQGQGALPDILGKKLATGDVVALGALDKPQDRLALLGGPAGILKQMTRDRVTPDLKTVTQLLDALPPDTHAEQALLESMKNIGLEPDTQFFNMLIRKRHYRHDTAAAQEVLTLMQCHHLIPDLVTYGCLALGCRTTHSALQLLRDMDAAQFRPNLQILTILVKNSLVTQNYALTVAMLSQMHRRGTTPDHHLLSLLEQVRAKARNTLLAKHDCSTREGDKTRGAADKFLGAYKTWLKASQVQLPEHPWTQYRQCQGDAHSSQ